MTSLPKRLIYVIGTYPLLTTTFIDREIEMLRRWGVDIRIVAMRRPDSDVPLSQQQRALQQGVIYLLPVAWVRLLLSQLYFMLRRPRVYAQTLIHLLTRPHPSLKARFKSALHFGEGVYAAYLLRDVPFRELHAHFVDRAATVALVAGRLLRRPYSLSIHAGADIFVNPVLLPEKIGAARHVATCTHFNKEYVERLIGRDLTDKMTQINHGLELQKYRPANGTRAGPALILGVGQLAERKGFHYLIRACRRLKDRGYLFSCCIIGRGPQEQALRALINQLSLENEVTLLGALPHEEVIDWYRRATLFALPCVQSRSGNLDGIPNVLAEAMAMELPVISTTVSAIPELIEDGVNGYLVRPEDDVVLTRAITHILDHPDVGIRMGRRARQSVLGAFDIECNVRRFATTLWPEWSKAYGNQTATR